MLWESCVAIASDLFGQQTQSESQAAVAFTLCFEGRPSAFGMPAPHVISIGEEPCCRGLVPSTMATSI